MSIPKGEPTVWDLYERTSVGTYTSIGTAMLVSSKTRLDAILPWDRFESAGAINLPVIEFVPNGLLIRGFAPDTTDRLTWLAVNPQLMTRET